MQHSCTALVQCLKRKVPGVALNLFFYFINHFFQAQCFSPSDSLSGKDSTRLIII